MPAGVKTIDIDRGWKKVKRQFKTANGSHTKIGVQQGEVRLDGTDLVTVAAANEFGVRRNGKTMIPARSFIRSTRDEKKSEIDQNIKQGINSMYTGNITMRKFLGRLGEWFKSEIQNKIDILQSPRNAPSTIARKGSANPLIDTGQMKQSIAHVEKIRGG